MAGTTHLAYKPEHAVDLDTGVIVAAKIHPADQGDTRTLSGTQAQAEAMLDQVGAAPTPQDPAEVITDKGYHARDLLKELEDSAWKSRIAEPEQKTFARWHGDAAARRAVYNNRARLRSTVAHHALSCGRRRSSAASPSSSTSAACAAPGCAALRMWKSAT